MNNLKTLRTIPLPQFENRLSIPPSIIISEGVELSPVVIGCGAVNMEDKKYNDTINIVLASASAKKQ